MADYAAFTDEILIPKSVAEAMTLVRRFHRKARENNFKYSVDTETSGLLWTVDELFMVQLYTEGMSLIIPLAWQEPSISVADLKAILGAEQTFDVTGAALGKFNKKSGNKGATTCSLISDTKLRVFLHNAKFDMHFLLNHGVELRNQIFDTCLAGFVLNVEKPAGLKPRSKVELGLEMRDFKDSFPLGGKKKLRLNDYPIAEVAKYAALDTFATYGLAEKFFVDAADCISIGGKKYTWNNSLVLRTTDPELMYVYDRIDSPMTEIFFGMERRGIRMDVPKLEEMKIAYKKKLEDLEVAMLAEAGMAFNMRSPKQVTQVFSRRGIALKSTDEAALKVVIRQRKDKLAELLIQHRGDTKILSTYIEAMLSYRGDDDRVHTSLNLHIAGTGRISSSQPINLQNQPKDAWWRSLFVAGPGKRLIVRDYSQIELRVLALLSKDPVLMEEYRNGVDVHMNNAKLIVQALGMDWSKLSEKEHLIYRQKAKSSLSFGVIYGMGYRSLAVEIGVSEDDAEALIMAVFNKYKIVDQWIKRVHHSALKTGYSKTMFGRRRDIPQVLSPDKWKMLYGLRQSCNSAVQGGAADIAKMGIQEAHRNPTLRKMGYRMLLPVHDELLGEVPEENAEEANLLVKKCLSDFPVARKLALPFPTEGGCGMNWHEAKEQKT